MVFMADPYCEIHRFEIPFGCVFADRHMVQALLNLAQQYDHAPAFDMRQRAKSLRLLGPPRPQSTGITSFVQPGQAKFVPALPPLLDAVQVQPELICRFCIANPWLNRKIPCARIRALECGWNTPISQNVRRSSSGDPRAKKLSGYLECCT
jgi:hypothetical protein